MVSLALDVLQDDLCLRQKVVNSVKATAVFDPNKESADAFAAQFGVKAYFDKYEEFLENVDAVYVASPHLTHYRLHKVQSLYAGKHVLCEIPFMLSAAQAYELYDYAEINNLVLLGASKTAFCPSFNHLVTLVKSAVCDWRCSRCEDFSPKWFLHLLVNWM